MANFGNDMLSDGSTSISSAVPDSTSMTLLPSPSSFSSNTDSSSEFSTSASVDSSPTESGTVPSITSFTTSSYDQYGLGSYSFPSRPTTAPTAFPSTPNTDNLTTSAKAGIGAGTAIGVPIIVLLAYIAFRLSRRKSRWWNILKHRPKSNDIVEADGNSQPAVVMELDSKEVGYGYMGRYPPAELQGSESLPVELEAQRSNTKKASLLKWTGRN